MKIIKEYKILDHGIEHEQYFQGCDVSFTKFTDVATGCGNNYAEAIDDCLEQLAQNNWNVKKLENLIPKVLRKNQCVPTGCIEEIHYYVSIRVK